MAILRSSSSIRNGNKSFAEERAAASLSDDLIAEIILKLPVKSVARCKCVAKNWCAAISHDYFRRRLPLQMSVLYFPDDTSRGKGPRFACAVGGGGGDGLLEDCDLSFFPFREGAVFCDACNGLLLFRSAGTTLFYVADPVTRRWAALPRPTRDAMVSVLAFDPLSSPRHYRVINFTGWRGRVAALEVFSSEAWAWAARDVEFGVPAFFLFGLTHFHDGAVYFLTADADRVVRVDVVSAGVACTVLDLPESMDGDGRVGHSGGLLHYVTSDGELLKVWVLEDGQWRLKHAVKVDNIVEGGCRGGEVRFLALHPEKDAVYMWSPWKLVEFDLAKKEITGAWQIGGKDHKGEKNRIVKTWLVPSSFYLSDCLADDQVQC